MIPSGYKEDIVYSAVPTDGSGDLSFTRASNGTRVNSAGLVEVCPWNLTEKSNDFANWLGVNNVTITANDTTAPNGTITASKIVVGSSSPIRIFDFIGSPTEGVYTISVYAKAGTGDEIILYTTNAYVYATYNLSNGTVTQGVGTASIENAGNGWYRCIVTNTIAAGEIGQVLFSGNSTNEYVYLYGYQTNVGSTAKPYFPTTDRLNVPRLTYQNGGGGCPSLLLEKQSTNLFSYSEQFDNAGWQKNDGTITANATTSPDGTQNADKSIPSTTNSDDHIVRQTISVTNGTDYTFSIYAKNGGYNFVLLNGANGSAVKVNLTDGSKTEYSSPTSTKVENLGNGWYRISITATANSTSYGATINIQNSATPQFPTWAGNGTDGVFLWGAQVEASSYPTSYIPTTSASATRVADACYKTGISSLIGQTEGTVFIEMTPNNLNTYYTERIIKIYGGGQDIGFQRYADSRLVCYGYLSGPSNEWTFDVANIFTSTTQSVKMAMAYKANDVAFYVNGIQKGTDSSASMFSTLSAMTFAEDTTGDLLCPQNMKKAILFKTRLTNAELASLTTI